MVATVKDRLERLRHPRYLFFLAVFVIASAMLLGVLPRAEAVLTGFDVAVAAFALSCAGLWFTGGPDEIRAQARRDDAGEVLLLLLTALICTVVLVTLVILVPGRKELQLPGIALLVSTLVASWTFANLIFAFHYARLYYTATSGQDHGGLDMPGGRLPDFSDFVNFAFVIGMTCQTADIAITHSRLRRVATFHGLFAFAFNLGILAMTVNVLASAG